MTWALERLVGSAADLHGRDLAADAGRLVEVCEVVRPALVLGSTQPPSSVDPAVAAADGVEVVRRRSGGGAVLLVPGRCTWIDVTIRRADPLWDDDVGVSFHWLGRAWADALGHLGVDARVHTAPPVESTWSRRICFAGLGAGEVVVGGRKLVGISQRRTREGARFQCLVHRAWDPVPLLRLLVLDDHERATAPGELRDVATGLDLDGARLTEALVASLPA